MKKIIESIAQGVYDGLQEEKRTQNKYMYQDIYDVLAEFVARFLFGCICTVIICMIWMYLKFSFSISSILILLWTLNFYYFCHSKEYKNLKKK